jgi:RNA polymerase sigma-70 factor (ECF subfamily)
MVAYVSGDQRAFAEIFRRYADVVTSLVRRRVRRHEDACDVVQQTFLQMHRARARFDPERLLRPWLFTIAANLSRDHARRSHHHREVTSDIEVAAPTSGDPLVSASERLRVRRALAALPANQREVLELHWIEGASYRDIAARTGASHAAVKLRAFRGRAALRDALR